WGASRAEYVEQFRAALADLTQPAAIRSAGPSDDNLASDIDFAISLIKRADGADCDSAIAWLQGLERYIIGRCNKSWGAGFSDGRDVGRLEGPTAAEVRREALEAAASLNQLADCVVIANAIGDESSQWKALHDLLGAIRALKSQPSTSAGAAVLPCKSCGADRAKEDCKGDRSNCSLKGEAYGVAGDAGAATWMSPAQQQINRSNNEERELRGDGGA
ncbi:hypothetical protein ACIPEN_14395, partial [Herbaspirillum chlorophenolicum]